MCETQDCPHRPDKGRRYCKKCESALLKKMSQEGYLTPIFGSLLRGRSPEQRENTLETKYGPDE